MKTKNPKIGIIGGQLDKRMERIKRPAFPIWIVLLGNQIIGEAKHL